MALNYQDPNPEFVAKVCVVGDLGVGKTQFIHQSVSNTFDPDYKATIGVDFALATFQFETRNVRLQLWDFAGQERFGHMTGMYFKEAKGLILMADAKRPTTIEGVVKWFDNFIENKEKNTPVDIPIVLIINKFDLVKDDKRSIQEIENQIDSFLKNVKGKYPNINIRVECYSAKENTTYSNKYNETATIKTGRDILKECGYTLLTNNNPLHEIKDINLDLPKLKDDPESILKLIKDMNNSKINDVLLKYVLAKEQFNLALILLLKESGLKFSSECLQDVGKQFKHEIKEALFNYCDKPYSKPDKIALQIYKDALASDTNLNTIFKCQEIQNNSQSSLLSVFSFLSFRTSTPEKKISDPIEEITERVNILEKSMNQEASTENIELNFGK